MTPLRRWLEVAHITAAGIWTGAVAMTGGAAAIIFPTVKSLNPALPGYPEYTGEHWRLAAGFVAARLFALNDIIQFVCAVVTGVTLLIIAASFDAWRTRITIVLRLTAFGIALLLLSYNFFVLAPRMNTNLDTYWKAAEIGDNAAALASQEAFMQDHGPASRTMAGTVLSALLLTGFGIASVTAKPRTADHLAKLTNKPTGTPKLQTPDLLSKTKS